MNTFTERTTVPTDSLAICRYLLPSSETALGRIVAEAIAESDPTATLKLEKASRPALDYLGHREYTEKKSHHPLLSLWSIGSLATEFNERVQNTDTPLAQEMTGTTPGDAIVRKTNGSHSIGFMFGAGLRAAVTSQRPEAIDLALDAAGVHPVDQVRMWRTEEHPGLWMPVIRAELANPDSIESLEATAYELQQAGRSIKLNFAAAQAKPVTYFIPVPQPGQ